VYYSLSTHTLHSSTQMGRTPTIHYDCILWCSFGHRNFLDHKHELLSTTLLGSRFAFLALTCARRFVTFIAAILTLASSQPAASSSDKRFSNPTIDVAWPPALHSCLLLSEPLSSSRVMRPKRRCPKHGLYQVMAREVSLRRRCCTRDPFWIRCNVTTDVRNLGSTQNDAI
jgi:hypothetical protein